MFLATHSHASGNEVTFTASTSRSVTASKYTAGKRTNKTSMHQERKWSRTTRVIENLEVDKTPDLREAEEDKSAWVDCDSDEDDSETTNRIMQPKSLITKRAGSGVYLPRPNSPKAPSSSFSFEVAAVNGLKIPSFTPPGTPSLFRDNSMASSSDISSSNSSSTVPSPRMYSSSSYAEQWSRIEHNTESLSNTSLAAAAKVKELSELFKRFELLFACVVRRQATQDTFLEERCLAGVQGLDGKTVDLARALEDLNKNVTKHTHTIAEIKNTINALNTTIDTLVLKIKKVNEFSPDTSKAISMLRVNTVNMSENIVTGTLVGFQAAIAYWLQFAASSFQADVLDMHKEITPRDCHGIQRSTVLGFGFDFEDEEDPLTQVLFPQGNGRFERSIIQVIEGTSQNRECFEEGFVKAGRGGGGGGGWCAVM